MAKKNGQRRVPTQDRAAFTVRSIVQATGAIIVDQGLDKATTNAVAERAGVSVGTLYQYFSNKEALIAALRDDHETQVREALLSAASDDAINDLEGLLRRMTRANIDVHLSSPRLHRVLTIDHPTVGLSSRHALCPMNAQMSDVFVLTERRCAQLCPHLESTVQSRPMLVGVFRLVEALTHSLVIDCPPAASAGELEEIVVASGLACIDSIQPGGLKACGL